MEGRDILYRKRRIIFNAPITVCFVLGCFIATLLGVISGGKITRSIFMTYHTRLSNIMMYVRLFTHVFGHSGWNHFIGNASYLLLLGPMLEEKYGSKELLEIIIITALMTGIANYILYPNTALCGASGVVFALILLSSFTNFSEGEIPITFILVAVLFIGQQVWEGLMVQNNISNMAHIMGGIIGSVIGYGTNKKGN